MASDLGNLCSHDAIPNWREDINCGERRYLLTPREEKRRVRQGKATRNVFTHSSHALPGGRLFPRQSSFKLAAEARALDRAAHPQLAGNCRTRSGESRNSRRTECVEAGRQLKQTARACAAFQKPVKIQVKGGKNPVLVSVPTCRTSGLQFCVQKRRRVPEAAAVPSRERLRSLVGLLESSLQAREGAESRLGILAKVDEGGRQA
ncbi:hypothetical protein RRG08_020482 [Elysia crispata]|uniref:Uncharacterized protein n=1 Tax=Elysia crispata TaxID=231223 RepID=A0AAE1D1V4_9GAST|nr:hypothetical protein RRG08_020482 [Elysia crispata]